MKEEYEELMKDDVSLDDKSEWDKENVLTINKNDIVNECRKILEPMGYAVLLVKIGDEAEEIKKMIGDKPIRTADLKRELIKAGYCRTLRTASDNITNWLAKGILYKWSLDKKNFYVSTKPLTLNINIKGENVK